MKAEKKLFDKELSLTKMLVEYHQKWAGSKSNRRTFRSFLNQDKKSKEKGMEQLRKYAINNVEKINYAAIYDNISGELIENVINNGKIV